MCNCMSLTLIANNVFRSFYAYTYYVYIHTTYIHYIRTYIHTVCTIQYVLYLSIGGLLLEELAVCAVYGRVDFRVEEDTALSDSLQRSRSLVGEP